MKFKFIIWTLLSAAVLVTSCDTMDELIPQEYNVILSMQQSGEQDLVLYRTGMNTEYEITAIKSGSVPTSTAKAEVGVMTDEDFEVYMDKIGKTYKKLPNECFQITGGVLDYASSEAWKKVKVIIDFDKTAQLVGQEKNKYVIPIKMTSETDSVLISKSELLLKLKDIVVPEVSITASRSYRLEKSGGEIVLPLQLQINNMWNFTAKVSLDESTTTLPGVSLADNGMVTFTAGGNGNLKILVPPFVQDVRGTVGVKIVSVEGMDFNFSAEPIEMSVMLDYYPLTPAMLDTHAQEPTEGPIENVLDGDINTFFHTRWSNPVPDLHDFIVYLSEPIQKFAFSYTTRAQNAVQTALCKFELWGGDSLDDLHLIRTYNREQDNLPQYDAQTFHSSLLTLDKPVKVIQLVNKPENGRPKFFTLSEFNMQVLE